MTSKAVVEGKLLHTSASQIKTFSMCQRKWYYEKVLNLRPPETAATNLGTAIHGEGQDHYEKGAQPEHGSLKLLLEDPRMPPRQAYDDGHLLVEFPRNYDLGIKAAGVPLKGRIDLVDLRFAPSERRARVIDFKTTSSFNYLKSEEELARDVQLNTYALHLLTDPYDQHPTVDTVSMSHAYMLTRGANATAFVETEPRTLPQVLEVWESVEETVAEMSRVAGCASPDDVTPNYKVCDRPFKCPYKAQCPGAPKSFFEELRSPVSTPTVTEQGITVTMSENLKNLKARQSGAVGINPPDATYYPPKTAAPVTTTATTSPEALVGTASASSLPNTGLTLYVNCVPVKGLSDYTVLEDEIARRAAPIAARAGVRDVREIDYGKGVAELVATFITEPLTGVVVATSDGLGAPVVSALMSSASVVLRGT